MQGHEDLEPTVHIRELKKDKVNFVLKNVDLAWAQPHFLSTQTMC